MGMVNDNLEYFVHVTLKHCSLDIVALEGLADECYAIGLSISDDGKVARLCFSDAGYAKEFNLIINLNQISPKKKIRKKK